MILYLAVTADKYELPLAVEEKVRDLSIKTGIKSTIITNAIQHNQSGRNTGIKFLKINIEGE